MKRLSIILLSTFLFMCNYAMSQAKSSTILYSTYYSGIGADDADVVAVDQNNNIYLGCHSNSPDLLDPSKEQYKLSGGIDAFIIKLDSKGDKVGYLAQLGGTEWDAVQGLVSDASGNIYAVGTTYSVDFPISTNSFQSNFGGDSDAFVVKLNPKGEVLWSTFLGGNKNEDGRDIILDEQGNLHIIGRTESKNFPTSAKAFQPKSAGGIDAFITTLNSDGKMISSTYLGGSGDDIGFSLSLSSNGQLYVSGTTNSTDFPVKDAIQNKNNGDNDIFLTAINKEKTNIAFSSYFGGHEADQLYSVCVNSFDEVFIMGVTKSSDYPTTKGAFQTVFGGVKDVFITKLNIEKREYEYSTYLGGNKADNPRNLVVNGKGNAIIVGNTASQDFPTIMHQKKQINGSQDAFVTILNTDGSSLYYSSLFGGNGNDVFEGITIGTDGSLTLSGATSSTDFSTLNPLQKTFLGGRYDMIIARLFID